MEPVRERLEELLRLLDENPELLEALQDRIVDEQAILRAIQKRAEVREAIRRQILHDEFLQLPELMRQLIEAQQRNAAQLQEHNHLIRRLIESPRLEAILWERLRLLREHSRLLQQLIESQQRHEAILQEHTRQLQEHSRLLQQLIESQQRHEAILQEHTRQLQEHSRLLQQLIESQQRHEAILQEHAQQLRELTAQVQRVVAVQERIAAVQERMARDLHELREWRKGFEGLQRGAELEKEVRQRARTIFAGGRGGHPESPYVIRLLKSWLRTLNGDDPILDAKADPTAADLIWSKGGKVIVVEVSAKVDRDDVDRACARANTLRGAGIDAVPVVIGDKWTSDKTRARAEMRGVEWYVGGQLSEGFIELRRIPDDADDAEE